MNTSEHEEKHRELTRKILGVFFEVYNELGHGFLDSVYQKSLGLALEAAGPRRAMARSDPVWYRRHQVGHFEGRYVSGTMRFA